MPEEGEVLVEACRLQAHLLHNGPVVIFVAPHAVEEKPGASSSSRGGGLSGSCGEGDYGVYSQPGTGVPHEHWVEPVRADARDARDDGTVVKHIGGRSDHGTLDQRVEVIDSNVVSTARIARFAEQKLSEGGAGGLTSAAAAAEYIDTVNGVDAIEIGQKWNVINVRAVMKRVVINLVRVDDDDADDDVPVYAQVSISLGAASTITSEKGYRTERLAAAAAVQAASDAGDVEGGAIAAARLDSIRARESRAAAERAVRCDLQIQTPHGTVCVVGRDHGTRSTHWVVHSRTGGASGAASLNGIVYPRRLFGSSSSPTRPSLNAAYACGAVLATGPTVQEQRDSAAAGQSWPWPDVPPGACLPWEGQLAGPSVRDLQSVLSNSDSLSSAPARLDFFVAEDVRCVAQLVARARSTSASEGDVADASARVAPALAYLRERKERDMHNDALSAGLDDEAARCFARACCTAYRRVVALLEELVAGSTEHSARAEDAVEEVSLFYLPLHF